MAPPEPEWRVRGLVGGTGAEKARDSSAAAISSEVTLLRQSALEDEYKLNDFLSVRHSVTKKIRFNFARAV